MPWPDRLLTKISNIYSKFQRYLSLKTFRDVCMDHEETPGKFSSLLHTILGLCNL